jgi:hypothetical protein
LIPKAVQAVTNLVKGKYGADANIEVKDTNDDDVN